MKISDKNAEIIIKSLIKNQISYLRKLNAFEIDFSDVNDDFLKNRIDSFELINIATSVSIFFNIHKTGFEDYLLKYKSIKDWASLANAALEKNKGTITFQTSGSTGKPKNVEHNLEDLFREAKELHHILSPFDRIRSFVPPHHIYGFLYGIALSEYSSIDNAIELNLKISSLKGNDLIIAVPVQWEAWKDYFSSSQIKIKGTVSTGKINNSTFNFLKENNVDLYEFYGSTETLGIGFRNEAEKPFRLFSYYKFENNSLKDLQKNIFIELQDEISIIDEYSFYLQKRKDRAIKISGKKIYLDDYKNALLTNSKIKDCELRTYETPIGEQIKALIIPISNDEDTKRDIMNFIDVLNLPCKISNIRFADSIPKNLMGKTQDWD